MTNNNLYIPSIEASKVYEHMVRGNSVSFNFDGMIPESLELLKMKSLDAFTKFDSDKSTQKRAMNTAVINVKFETKVKSGAYILESIPNIIKEKKKSFKDLIAKMKIMKQGKKPAKDDWNRKLKELKKIRNSMRYFRRLKERINSELKQLQFENKWSEVSSNNLRKDLYANGFTIKLVDYETGEITETNYKFYKRSSSKSRKGEAWFICEELYDVMSNWSRMDIPFVKGENVDLASLMAYESLVTSSICGTVTIDPKSILMIDEQISKFEETVNVVYTKEYKKTVGNKVIEVKELDSKQVENYKIDNSIHDGEALCDSSLFTGQFEGKGFMLLRFHMFKAAGFSTNLVDFYKHIYGDKYETATVEDMFGNTVNVRDIRMVINPTCLKALKFSKFIGTKNDMWNHWKLQVEKDNNIFGVCKTEKGTKRGKLNGLPLQRTSYQMINSLDDVEPADIEALVNVVERGFIDSLRNNDDAFIEYIKGTANEMNSNKMFVDLYSVHKDIVRTKMFRTFRTKTISKYVETVKKGKIRLVGDYCVMLSCPIQYLYASVNAEMSNVEVLKGNQIHTSLFGENGYNKEYVAFRNPHSSASNIYKCFNVKNELIEQYFNLTPNIVVVNSDKENVMNRLNGADFDSDSIVIFDNADLSRIVSKSYDDYKVCFNDIDNDTTPYVLSNEDSAKIDNALAGSTTQIGEVTNCTQLILSLIAHKVKKGMSKDHVDIKKLMKYVEITTVLAGISIDSAKRQYKVNPSKVLNKIRKELTLNEIDFNNTSKEIQKYIKSELKEDKNQKFYGKPNFWKFVQNDDHTKNKKKVDEQENKEDELIEQDSKKKEKKKDKPLLVTHYDCPMDYLFDVKFDRADGKDPLKFKDLLVDKDKRGGNRGQKKQLEDLADDYQNEITHAIMTSEEDELNVQLEEAIEKYEEKFSKFKVNENTMYALLLEVNDQTENGKKKEDKNNSCMRLMNQLYKFQKQMFLNAFKQAN